MAEHDEEFARDVERYGQAQKDLTDVLQALDGTAGQAPDVARLDRLQDALVALANLREFLVRDLGTTVSHVQSLEHGLTSLGDFANAQRESLSDLSATVAALVDVLLTQGTVSPDDLAAKKTELIAAAQKQDADNATN